jgi:CheY-like chemotaxis protein
MPGIDGIEVLRQVKQTNLTSLNPQAVRGRRNVYEIRAFACLESPWMNVLSETIKKANENKARQE